MGKHKIPSGIFIIIFLIFVSSYYVSNSGYYEYELSQKTILTNEKIKEFEEAIKNNQNIDEIDFLTEEDNDYTNKISDLMYNISDKGNQVFRLALKNLFKKLSYLVQDE